MIKKIKNANPRYTADIIPITLKISAPKDGELFLTTNTEIINKMNARTSLIKPFFSKNFAIAVKNVFIF
jgi:hypothetical protein